jgi:hypothetical protein
VFIYCLATQIVYMLQLELYMLQLELYMLQLEPDIRQNPKSLRKTSSNKALSSILLSSYF